MTEWIGCTVSNDKLAQIDALIVRTGQTRNEWLQSLVQVALSEKPHNIRHLTERVERLEQQQELVTALAQQVNVLSQHFQAQVSGGGTQHLDVDPPELRPVGNPIVAPGPRIDQASHPAITLDAQTGDGISQDWDDEDLDDQPDEILYEFLESASSSDKTDSDTHSSGTTISEPSIYDADDEPDEVLYDFLDEDDRPF